MTRIAFGLRYVQLSSLHCSQSLLCHHPAMMTRNVQLKRSFVTMKFDAQKPVKKNEGSVDRPKGPAAKRGPTRSSSSSSNGGKVSTSQKGDAAPKLDSDGVRLNKCLHGLSRRGADDAIAEGRVTINNAVATNGMKVKKRDIVRLVCT